MTFLSIFIPTSWWRTLSSRWTRGALIADPKFILCERVFRITWEIADPIRLLPPLPRTSSGPDSPTTIVGDINVGSLCCFVHKWNPEGLRTSSPSILFIINPISGIKYPHPSPFVVVTLAAFPVLSIMLTCVVDPNDGVFVLSGNQFSWLVNIFE